MKRLRHDTGMQIIALIAIVFAAAQWGGQDLRFGLALALVGLIAFLAGRRDRRRRRAGRASIVAEFLASWRYCPVSTATNPSRDCLEDAAHQLLETLDGSR